MRTRPSTDRGHSDIDSEPDDPGDLVQRSRCCFAMASTLRAAAYAALRPCSALKSFPTRPTNLGSLPRVGRFRSGIIDSRFGPPARTRQTESPREVVLFPQPQVWFLCCLPFAVVRTCIHVLHRSDRRLPRRCRLRPKSFPSATGFPGTPLNLLHASAYRRCPERPR